MLVQKPGSFTKVAVPQHIFKEKGGRHWNLHFTYPVAIRQFQTDCRHPPVGQHYLKPAVWKALHFPVNLSHVPAPMPRHLAVYGLPPSPFYPNSDWGSACRPSFHVALVFLEAHLLQEEINLILQLLEVCSLLPVYWAPAPFLSIYYP